MHYPALLMTRTPIGTLLVQAGVLTESALADILEIQRAEKRRLGDLLAETNVVPPRQLAQVLSYQLSCPWLSLTNVEIPRAVIELLPRDLAIGHTAVPVHVREGKEGVRERALYVAMYDPTDLAAIDACARAAGMPVKPMVAITYEIRQALAKYYGAPVPSLTTAPAPFRSPTPPAAWPMPPIPRRPPPVPSATPAEPPRPGASSVLVLNAPSGFRAQCVLAAEALSARVVDGTLITASDVAKQCAPVAIVVTEDVYAFDRAGLNRLAIEQDAHLVVWSEDVEAAQLSPLLAGAIERARRAAPVKREATESAR